MAASLDLANIADELFVLETHDGNAYLGELLVDGDFVTVRTGFVGRPPVIAVHDVARVVPASAHPDVVSVGRPKRG
jgi:hypothetical protein